LIPATPVEDETTVWIEAQDLVKRVLKSPSTASFGGWTALSDDYQDPHRYVIPLGNGEYVVAGWVDSQNSFGVTVRPRFNLLIRKSGDRWTMSGTPVMTSN
jgi:hypothetical protein